MVLPLLLAAGVSLLTVPEATARVSSNALLAFYDWFSKRGGRALKVEVSSATSHGLGVRAVLEVSEGEELVSLPLAWVLCRQSVLNADPSWALPADARDALAAVPDDADLLAVLLLRERALGTRSAWAAYISLLPRRGLPLPSTLHPSDAEKLLDRVAQSRAAKARAQLETRHKRLSVPLRLALRDTSHSKDFLTLEAFRWASALVDSRALTLSRHGKFLVPFADLLNYGPHPHKRSSAAGEFFEKHHNIHGHRFVVTADRATFAGDEVLEDYGDNDNELYFHSFGFVPTGNPFDCVTVRLSKPAGSEHVLLLEQLRVPARPEACLQPGGELPPRILYHLHMLAMSDDAAAACREEVARAPEKGALGCFSEQSGYTLERAKKRLSDILVRRLRSRMPDFKELTATETDHELAPHSEELLGLADRFAHSRRKLLQRLVTSLSAGEAGNMEVGGKLTADEQHNEDAGDETQLGQLLFESTKSYLAALRAARGVDAGRRTWPEGLESLLKELEAELKGALAREMGSAVPEELRAFNAWFSQQLAGKLPMRVRAVEVPGMRYGVEAIVPIAAGEVYLSVPPCAMLDRRTALESELGPAILEIRQFFGRGDAFHELLLHLLHERFVRKESSRWWPYLRLLPEASSLNAPYFLEEEAVQKALGPSALIAAVKKQRQELRTKYSQIMDRLLERVAFFQQVADAFSFARYEWATFILNTRSIWWHGERHLVPMLDFVNCQAVLLGANAEGSALRVHATVADAHGNGVTRAASGFSTGEQVLENYGQPNHVYYLHHGFTLQNNPHDCLLWPVMGDSTCLDPARLEDSALLSRIAGTAKAQDPNSAADAAGAVSPASAAERGRRVLLTELKKHLQQQQHSLLAAPADTSARMSAAIAFAASERVLVRRLIVRLTELNGAAEAGGDCHAGDLEGADAACGSGGAGAAHLS